MALINGTRGEKHTQMMSYLDTKRPGRKSKFVLFLFNVLLMSSICFGGDVPIERDFLRLPDHRWIWLEKTGWHTTRIILGKGKKSFKNRIWSKVYETDGNRHTWEYAFFVKIKQDQFIVFDKKKNPQIAISTYDMGNGAIRWAILFQVKKDRLEIIKEIDGFNVAADDAIFH